MSGRRGDARGGFNWSPHLCAKEQMRGGVVFAFDVFAFAFAFGFGFGLLLTWRLFLIYDKTKQ